MTSTARPTPDGPTCAVIIVCLNNRKYLEPCLQSLFGAEMHNQLEVVVIDNGSTDGTPELVRSSFPRVAVIQNHENVGLGQASNQGIEATTAPYVLLLNDDTLVNGTSLDAMIDTMASLPDAGAVGGTLLNPDGTLQTAYNHFPSLLEEFLIATRLGVLVRKEYPALGGGTDVRPVDWIGSACLLLRRAALAQVGLLDEHYFIYGDEADLQYRIVKAGWRVYHVPEATTIHFGGRSLDRWRRRKMVYRGKMLFFKKNYGAPWEHLLRGMLGILTMAKVAVWTLAWPVPWLTERARRELRSNADVLRLCVRLH